MNLGKLLTERRKQVSIEEDSETHGLTKRGTKRRFYIFFKNDISSSKNEKRDLFFRQWYKQWKMIKRSWRYTRVLRRGEGGSNSTVQRVAISRESRGRKWGKVKFSSRDQRRRERFWLWSRVRTPFEPRGRPSQKEGGGRGKKGLRNKKRLRSSKLRGRAPGRRHGRLRERAMRFWCSTVWMHRAGPAEKTSACWRHYYPPWSKQAAENRSGKIAYFPTLVSYYVTGIFPWSNVKIQTLLLIDYPAFPINSIFGNSPKNSTGWRWRKKKRK